MLFGRKSRAFVIILLVVAATLCLNDWVSGAQPPPSNPPPPKLPGAKLPAPKLLPPKLPPSTPPGSTPPVAPVTPTAPSPTGAKFDSSVIYDEFDSLMNKEFLTNPGKYVQTVGQRLSRQDYNSMQKGKFLLKPERQGLGIAIVHTNKNTWGKLLFTWGAPTQNGQPSLILKEVILFGRVMDGFSPRKMENLIVGSSNQVDLDTGNANAGNAADVWFHNVDGNEMYIEAVNGATLEFPMESMCR